MAKTKMEFQDAVSAYIALNSFTNSARLGWELSWQIDDLIEALEKTAKRHDKETKEINEAYGKWVEGPQPGIPGYWDVPDDSKEEHQKAIDTLMESTITIDIEPLDFEELKKSGVKVQGREMKALKKHFIKRGTKDAKSIGDSEKKEAVEEKVKKSVK